MSNNPSQKLKTTPFITAVTSSILARELFPPSPQSPVSAYVPNASTRVLTNISNTPRMYERTPRSSTPSISTDENSPSPLASPYTFANVSPAMSFSMQLATPPTSATTPIVQLKPHNQVCDRTKQRRTNKMRDQLDDMEKSLLSSYNVEFVSVRLRDREHKEADSNNEDDQEKKRRYEIIYTNEDDDDDKCDAKCALQVNICLFKHICFKCI
jgi:hypothetical protein